jgi:hypothetical protein
MTALDSGSVSMDMRATPQAVWDLVSDVTRIGELSPETFEAQWLGHATCPEPGAWFRGHVKRNERGPIYWTKCRVTDAEPGRSFGFDVYVGSQRVNHWRYDIEPTPDGCTVTESYRALPSLTNRIYWHLLGRWRARTNEHGMTQTLLRVKAIVEHTA